MILLDQAAGTTRTPPDAAFRTRKGRPTVIILERDGSLHHYPPDRPDQALRQAQGDLDQAQAQPTIIARIIDFTFDVLGIGNLEARIHDYPRR